MSNIESIKEFEKNKELQLHKELEEFVNVFAGALEIDASLVSDDLKYNSIPKWDSIAHMTLIAALENHYDIMLDTDDIIDMSSVGKAKEILSKYDVKLG